MDQNKNKFSVNLVNCSKHLAKSAGPDQLADTEAVSQQEVLLEEGHNPLASLVDWSCATAAAVCWT